MAGTRRVVVVLIMAALGVLLTAGVAAARDYPPKTSSVNTEAVSTAPASHPAATSTAGLPFTGGNDAALAWVGLAAVAGGTLFVVRTRRRSHA